MRCPGSTDIPDNFGASRASHLTTLPTAFTSSPLRAYRSGVPREGHPHHRCRRERRSRPRELGVRDCMVQRREWRRRAISRAQSIAALIHRALDAGREDALGWICARLCADHGRAADGDAPELAFSAERALPWHEVALPRGSHTARLCVPVPPTYLPKMANFLRWHP